MPKEQVSLVLTGQAIASLRESDFDTRSAVGEVVDNSLQAGASKIQIKTGERELPARGRRPAGTKQLHSIAFGDDGHGMDGDTLHRCLQLGYSTRYNDRSGIGRFGVGMTLGAISQCTRIAVYSRAKGSSEWLHTVVDLEKADTDATIPEPKPKAPPAEYLPLAGAEHGTIVIWDKFDRPASTSEEIGHWIARTYRKFIGTSIIENNKVVPNPNVREVLLNGERIFAHDPLFVINNGHFPDATTAELFDEIPLPMPVTDARAKGGGVTGDTSNVLIRMSILPESWRQMERAGGSPLAKKLRIIDNEGFSVLRANREVFYDVMPHFQPAATYIDRWWGAEVLFEPALDSSFSVRNIKQGARFVRELREKIQELMAPTIEEVRERVKKIYASNKVKQQFQGVDVATEHTPAEQTVQEVGPAPGKAGRTKTEEEKQREIDEIIKPLVRTADELAAWRAKIESQPCTIVDQKEWRGDTFLDIHPHGGRTIIEYNRSHPFFVYVYDAIRELESVKTASPEHVEKAKVLKKAIDLLFMAFAQASNQFDPEQDARAAEALNLLRANWGVYLRQYVQAAEKADIQAAGADEE